MTLGDEEARTRGTQKSVLERKGPPTFPIVVEMRDRGAWVAHDTSDSVDTLLKSRIPKVQVSCGVESYSLLCLCAVHVWLLLLLQQLAAGPAQLHTLPPSGERMANTAHTQRLVCRLTAAAVVVVVLLLPLSITPAAAAAHEGVQQP